FNGKTYPTGPAGVDLYDDFGALHAARVEMDQEILAWARSASAAELAEPMTWTSRLYGFTQTHPRWVQVVQMFNHQTHHRGQVHAMLTAAGVDVGPTDVPVLPLLNA
ncbi:MAG TPA: DinB family protein, partial [Polyangia bacterium]|nr:DinB family protein [Polyangia bacterium]